jgi:hypothetical protein
MKRFLPLTMGLSGCAVPTGPAAPAPARVDDRVVEKEPPRTWQERRNSARGDLCARRPAIIDLAVAATATRVVACASAPTPSFTTESDAIEAIVASSKAAQHCQAILATADGTVTRNEGCAGSCMSTSVAQSLCNAWDATGRLPSISPGDVKQCTTSLRRTDWIPRALEALTRGTAAEISQSCDRTRVLDLCFEAFLTEHPTLHCNLAAGVASL